MTVEHMPGDILSFESPANVVFACGIAEALFAADDELAGSAGSTAAARGDCDVIVAEIEFTEEDGLGNEYWWTELGLRRPHIRYDEEEDFLRERKREEE